MGVKILKSSIASVAAGLILMIAPSSALATEHHDNGNDNEHNKVTICHATGSASNPFVMISPDANGVISGHVAHQNGNDIIPPFDYNDHGVTKHFPGQNWDTNGQATFNNDCLPIEGGQGGGPQKDCDNDFDSSPASECTTTQPQMDCDSDTDNSPATECATGGQGGGPTGGTTTTTTPQVLGASTVNTTQQVAVVPQGSVNGGEGAASRVFNRSSALGLVGSMLSVGSGLVMLNRRHS